MPGATIPLPVFTYLLKDNSGAVFLRAGSKLLMPIFTSEENAFFYRQRAAIDCNMIRIDTVEDLKSYIANPPSRADHCDNDFDIVIDPIDATVGQYLLFQRSDMLDALGRSGSS